MGDRRANEPGGLEDAEKFERSEHGEAERRGVKEHVPRDLEVAETQDLRHRTFRTPLLFPKLRSIIIMQRTALGWLGSRVVSVLDSGAEGPGFKSQS